MTSSRLFYLKASALLSAFFLWVSPLSIYASALPNPSLEPAVEETLRQDPSSLTPSPPTSPSLGPAQTTASDPAQSVPSPTTPQDSSLPQEPLSAPATPALPSTLGQPSSPVSPPAIPKRPPSSWPVPSQLPGNFSNPSSLSLPAGALPAANLPPSLPSLPNPSVAASAAGQSEPKLIVTNYQSAPSPIRAGETFSLSLSLQNTHPDKKIRNIRLRLEEPVESQGLPNAPSAPKAASGPIFLPVDFAGTLFLPQIAPSAIITRSVQLTATRDAAPGLYPLQIQTDYETLDRQSYNASQTLYLQVAQPARLEISPAMLPAQTQVGETAPLSVEFHNLGKAPLYNLQVQVSASSDYQIENGSFFLGALAPGTSDTFEASLLSEKIGDFSGHVEIRYEDAAGKSQSQTQPFSLHVQEAPAAAQPPAKERPWLFPVLALSACSALAMAYFLRRKSRRGAGEELKIK